MPNNHIDFGVDLLPATDLGYNLGNANQRWKIFGAITGSADTLTTTRKIWGQDFNGSADITGNIINAGDQFKLIQNKTEVQFLTSTGGAANGKFGKLGLNSSYAGIDFTNYTLDVNGKTRLAGQVFINYTTAANANTKSGQLLVTSGTGSNDVAIELFRNSSASWQIINNSGTLRFRNNYVSSAASTYNKEALSIAYNTGNATFAGTVTSTGFVGPLTGTASGNVANTGATGDLLYWSNTDTPARLNVGTDGQILKLNDGLPSWSNEYKIEILRWT